VGESWKVTLSKSISECMLRRPTSSMVKLWNAANRLPTHGGVAVFARNVDWSVRIVGHQLLRRTMLALTKGLKGEKANSG